MSRGVLLLQLWMKVLCRLISACFLQGCESFGGSRGNVAITSVESLCRSEFVPGLHPQVIGTSCLFQNRGSLGLDD